MPYMNDSDNLLSVLESLMPPHPDDVAADLARDFRKRRIEKDITREEIAAKARIPVSNVARFEQKGLISLQNLIKLATALGYVSEIHNIFKEPKYQTMQELKQIKENSGKKKARGKNRHS